MSDEPVMPSESAKLVDAIDSAVIGPKKVTQSITWLTKNAEQLAKWENVEHWAVDTGGEDGPIAFHLVRVRAALARQLWQRELFVGASVLDDHLFDAVREGHADPVRTVLQLLLTTQALSAGYVIYPLRSFGFRGAQLLLREDRPTAEVFAREFGFAVTPAVRTLNGLCNWLQDAQGWLGVEGTAPRGLLAHWERSRAKWLYRNPLLVVRVHALSGTYYENQRLIVDRLHVTTAFLAALAVIQPDPDTDLDRLYSSSKVNNFATSNVQHYFIMSAFTNAGGELLGDPVPMNVQAGYLGELTDLPVDLDMAYWDSHVEDARPLWDALKGLADLEVRARFGNSDLAKRPVGRTNRKIFESLDFFRRSLDPNRWYSVTSLGTAIEMLLTSRYAPGVTARLARRAALLTGSDDDGRKIAELYDSRSKMVHEGIEPPEGSSMLEAQRAYLRCLVVVADRLPTLKATDDDPLRTITNDIGQQSRLDVLRDRLSAARSRAMTAAIAVRGLARRSG